MPEAYSVGKTQGV